MRTFNKLRDLLWPYLEPFSEGETKRQTKQLEEVGDRDAILKKIEHIKGEDYARIFFESSRELYNREEERLKIVEGKSAILLCASALITALIVNVISHIAEGFTVPYKIIGGVIILLTSCYFLAVVFYVLKALSVGKYYNPKIEDIIDSKLTHKKSYYKQMGSIYCSSRVKNYKTINEKVDFVGLAQDFFIRGTIMVVLTGFFIYSATINFGTNLYTKIPEILIASFWISVFILGADIILNIIVLRKKRKADKR